MLIKESDSKKRADFIDFLEKNGYVIDETEPHSRQIIIDDFLPIKVNSDDKTYSMMGNVTCAAAVAGSSKGRCFISMEEAYEKITLLDKKEP